MGYRSCVAIALYGTPSKVDIVDNLLDQSLDDEFNRGLFESAKQVKDREVKHEHSVSKLRTIVWTFDDVKWYDELDSYKDKLFYWVEEMNDSEPDHEKDFYLAIEFVRVGENTEDTEEQYSDHANNDMYVSRCIELPNGFEWKA